LSNVEESESTEIIKNEEDEKIEVGFGVLFELFSFCDSKYGGRYSLVAIVLAHILINVMVSSLSLYLAYALSDPENMSSLVLPLLTIMLITFIITIAGKFISSLIFMSINRNLHDAAINSLVRTDLAFFDTNTSGRIINRLSRDISDIDAFVFTFLEMCDYWVKCSFSLIFILISAPWLFIYLVFELYYFYSLKQKILKITADCRRLIAVTNSPIVSLI
jgi:ATP-binding cassette, subfamily C (CFTR/MRP), member 1